MIDPNIPKIPILLAAAGLAVALLLGFALNPTPAFAKPPPCKEMGTCGGGGGDPEETFSVAVVVGTDPEGENWLVTTCDGVTSGGLGASFPFGCGVIDANVDGGQLYLWLIGVNDRTKGARVDFWFTTHDFSNGLRVPSETGYQSRDRFPATIIRDAQGVVIEFEVPVLNAEIIKAAQPDKGTVVGKFSVGTIEYF